MNPKERSVSESREQPRPLDDQELEILCVLRRYGLTGIEMQTLYVLEEARVAELAILRPPSFRDIILGTFSKKPTEQRRAQEESQRARPFYEELVSLPDEERRKRYERIELLEYAQSGWTLDTVRARIPDFQEDAKRAELFLQERRALRALTPMEDEKYKGLVSKFASGEFSAQEEERLNALQELARREGDLWLGYPLDLNATVSPAMAAEALAFFEEWEALTPQDQKARYDRIMELEDREWTVLQIIKAKKELEESERIRTMEEILAQRNPAQLTFENALFEGGALAFETPEAYVRDNPGIERLGVSWIIWAEHFKGKIPKRWGDHWAYVEKDFENAREAGVQLSKILIDAGVTHPHWHVVETVAKTQRLTPLQIALAFEGGDAQHFREAILNGQRRMGTPEADIKEASYIFLTRGNFHLKEIPFRE